MPVAVILIRNGVFPISPSRPRTAISIDLLDIYRALFERSCDAITALAAALHTIYDRRGFRVIQYTENFQGLDELAKDPFRVGLAQAVQWYSNLRANIQRRLDTALAAAEELISPSIPMAAPAGNALEVEEASSSHGPTPGRAHRILRERCPACFGLETWGRPLSDGGDVQLGADGCFSYRHLRSAGDGPISYDPSYFVSKEKVDCVRERIVNARGKKPAVVTPLIPQEAIDACEASWDAANEKKQKVDPKRHDASGIFVMTCRHSQVLFLCDITTPGEQQQYIVALMEEAASLLPPHATLVQAYDVGCVTDHSLNLFPILSEGLRERVCFVINAMHSYGHQWVCQIVYSPRLRRGLCLTDAEGVERFWSRIRKLIGITRNQWNSWRIWMIDQYAAFVNEEGRDSLGGWIYRQEHKNLAKKRTAAQKMLRDCGVSEEELRRNWEEQKAAQTSIRSHAPMRLRRELDKVLTLQAQIDGVEKSIAEVKQSITTPDASTDSIIWLRDLEKTNDTLSTQAQALYASLNIEKSFPELQNLPLDFVRTLLMMRDLKINIRKRAVGTFYEWENLDRAVGGRREALGTKLHQSTRKAISKRQPALLRSIAKFNGYCADLERLRPPGCTIPVPSPLSTQLNGLRDDPSLHEDVWITPTEGQIPRWLNDSDVRDGIHALHSADRCAEESQRLNMERANLVNWLNKELSIVTAAINTLTDSCLSLELQLRREKLQFLRVSWKSATAMRPEPLIAVGAEAYVPASISVLDPSVPSMAPTQPRTVTIELTPEEDMFEDDALELSAFNMVAAEELDPGSISDMEHEDVLLVQEMLSNDAEEEESTAVEADSLNFEISWRCPMEASDLAHVESSTGRLTGCGLNALAGALLNFFGHPTSPDAATANNCAILNTYDLVRVRYKASDDILWKNVHLTKFWDKPLWLIPIHRVDQEHWVLMVVDVTGQQLLFFDSLGGKSRGWRQDIRVSKRDHRQSNGYDCGLWVLCMMGAILRGYATTGVSELQMGRVRKLLTDHILGLPYN
ncbi:hypothetical protein C8R44DRAFT_827907 [Mycena epipterygia]|nr:hypothetical protein C8R44DRAFT_827907 [Mycena epipterygia]